MPHKLLSLAEALPAISKEVAEVPFRGTWAGLFHLQTMQSIGISIAKAPAARSIHTIIRESAKPGREPERVVVQALDTWSDTNIDSKKKTSLLREALQAFVGALPEETWRSPLALCP